MSSHFETLQGYYRIGELPIELSVTKAFALTAKHLVFQGKVPNDWRAIHGRSMGADFMLPHEQAVAVEDIDSVVILWDAVPGGQKGFDGTFGYVQAQRLDFDRFIVLPFGDTAAIEELRQTVAHWDNTLKIDYGMVMDTAHDPGRGPTGFLGGICPFLSYVVDPEMGTTTNERRNPEILNQMFSQFPGWQNYAVLAKPYFSERYVKETQSAVIEALHQYALMTK